RARRQSQIETLALARSDGREAVEEDPLHLARERRLEVGDGGQRHADRGRDHRLVSAALGRQRDAGRRGGHEEPATGVERVIQPARCVVTATSAETVTTASPSGRRASAPRTRPNASCVDIAPMYVSSSARGTAGAAARGGGVHSGGSRRTCAASAPAGSNPA